MTLLASVQTDAGRRHTKFVEFSEFVGGEGVGGELIGGTHGANKNDVRSRTEEDGGMRGAGKMFVRIEARGRVRGVRRMPNFSPIEILNLCAAALASSRRRLPFFSGAAGKVKPPSRKFL